MAYPSNRRSRCLYRLDRWYIYDSFQLSIDPHPSTFNTVIALHMHSLVPIHRKFQFLSRGVHNILVSMAVVLHKRVEKKKNFTMQMHLPFNSLMASSAATGFSNSTKAYPFFMSTSLTCPYLPKRALIAFSSPSADKLPT